LPIVNGNTTFIADQSNSDMLQNSSDLYNGNIARMVTTITDPNSRAVLPLGNAYQYDQLNRLKHAVSFDQLNGNAWAGGAPAKYENSFTYDANGNILTQTRNDDNNQVIDELAYFYPKNAANKTVRNRLLYVSDNVDYDASDIDPGMTANNYAYDEEGRLIQDLQEQIASIEWRVDGKVKRINRIANSTKQNLSFDYDAMGHRIAKHVYTSANVLEKSTYYVLDAQGNTMATYERAVDENTLQISYAQTEKFIYGSSRLGVQNCNIALLGSQNNTYTQTTVAHRIGKKGYELSNYLGNVLSVISDKVIPHQNGTTVDHFLADIRQSSDYSPFGVQLENRTLSKNGVTDFVRFGYQGSEMDNELKDGANSYTTFFRQLDPRLGRWMSIDPKVNQFPWQSPYCSMDNNPISLNDIFGANTGDDKKNNIDLGSKTTYSSNIVETTLERITTIEKTTTSSSINAYTGVITTITTVSTSTFTTSLLTGDLSIKSSDVSWTNYKTYKEVTGKEYNPYLIALDGVMASKEYKEMDALNQWNIRQSFNAGALDWANKDAGVRYREQLDQTVIGWMMPYYNIGRGIEEIQSGNNWGWLKIGLEIVPLEFIPALAKPFGPGLAYTSRAFGYNSYLFGIGRNGFQKGVLNSGVIRMGWGFEAATRSHVLRVGIGNNPKFYAPTKMFGLDYHYHINLMKTPARF
jgi:RHS repeat-associated protein